MSARLKSSSSERNRRTEIVSGNDKSVGCDSCSYRCLLTSSADYPGNIMVTHFTVPAPNSVLLQVSKSSPSRDKSNQRGENYTSESSFQNKNPASEPRVEMRLNRREWERDYNQCYC